ncbi:MAG: MerR family transcriptional regulator [Runella slithyformis]|nr:MAG: MerR family transcriptional regulator [Runella slithyformis]TAE99579.1 MAG: MerR family transcriptional regulator [Runella slithyformis]TAF29086.1 MAG: MerR family transcriptional regulator [Runella slithyformis]TAF48721.1 MAG: MerR family transcriptional regulator [Runella slithyformis]TAF80262.1 MAG: MerR family transcriptional regulator [Runella slithyformis]
MSSYSIRDLEQLSGIKAHTLRIWEQRYNIIQPKRTDTNIRFYDDQDLKLVLNISLLKEHGYKISEISKLSPEELNKEVLMISDRKLNYPDQIHALTISMIDLDEDRFEKIVSTNFLQFGFESTMINIIYPFLSRIGTLWVTGSIGPAQEHFITHLIRQKIIVAIDGQVSKPRADSKRFMLYLPEGELHEISLLFATYMIRSRNHKVIYLGQTLPFNELVFAYEVHKPDYIFTSITSVPSNDEVQNYVTRLCKQFPKSHILLTGYQVVGQDIEIETNAIIINKIDDLLEIIS